MKIPLLTLSLLGCSLIARSAQPASAPPPRSAVEAETTAEGCVVERFTVHSPSMDREIKAAVVLPPGYQAHPEKHYPILYALHGSGAPFDSFARMIPLRKALQEKPMIVACFDGDDHSRYIDSPDPLRGSRDPADPTLVKSLFTTFFFDELIPCLDASYRVDPARRMLTGFSMGGYGAFHYLLARPGGFVSVSSLSGSFPVTPGTPEKDAARDARFDLYGPLAKQLAAGTKLPPILLCCGTEDRLLPDSRAMHAFLEEHGVGCEYLATPGGHTWPYWRDTSPTIIDFHWRTLPGS